MDPDTVHCAHRLHSLLVQKHPYSRNINACTKRLITLITQSTTAPTNPQPYDPTKQAFQDDLTFLAKAIFEQATATDPPLTRDTNTAPIKTPPPSVSVPVQDIKKLLQPLVDTQTTTLKIAKKALDTKLAAPLSEELIRRVEYTIQEAFGFYLQLKDTRVMAPPIPPYGYE
jgi:hypothetical protein